MSVQTSGEFNSTYGGGGGSSSSHMHRGPFSPSYQTPQQAALLTEPPPFRQQPGFPPLTSSAEPAQGASQERHGLQQRFEQTQQQLHVKYLQMRDQQRNSEPAAAPATNDVTSRDLPQPPPLIDMSVYFSSGNFFHDALMHAAGNVDARGKPYTNRLPDYPPASMATGPPPPLTTSSSVQPVSPPTTSSSPLLTRPAVQSPASHPEQPVTATTTHHHGPDATRVGSREKDRALSARYPQYDYDRLPDYAAGSISKLERLNELIMETGHHDNDKETARADPPVVPVRRESDAEEDTSAVTSSALNGSSSHSEEADKSAVCESEKDQPDDVIDDPESYIQKVISSSQRGSAGQRAADKCHVSPGGGVKDTPEHLRLGMSWSADPPRKDEACTPSPPSSNGTASTPHRTPRDVSRDAAGDAAPTESTPKKAAAPPPFLSDALGGIPAFPGAPPLMQAKSPGGSKTPVLPRQPDTPASFLPELVVPAAPEEDLAESGGLQTYYCHLCSYVGHSKFHFNAHMGSHFEHRCPHCDYTSRTEGRLKRHIKDFHSQNPPENFSGQPPEGHQTVSEPSTTQPARGPKVYKCKQCDYQTTQKVEFWEHARTHIKADKILQCPKCPFVTEYKHHLEYHLRNHFGSKPFKCTKCNYSCVNKSMLNSHMKSHTNVYQYRCANCTYATKYCHSLKLHLKKYNHMPATVLNQDGSIPVDGSGDFELVSKRGPPRGPRHVRRSGSPPAPAKVVLPGMAQQMASQTVPPPGGVQNPFWPMMGGLPPLGMGLPPGPMPPSMDNGKPSATSTSENHRIKTEPPDMMNMFGMPSNPFMMDKFMSMGASGAPDMAAPPFPPAMWPLLGMSPGKDLPILPGLPDPRVAMEMMGMATNGRVKQNLAERFADKAAMETDAPLDLRGNREADEDRNLLEMTPLRDTDDVSRTSPAPAPDDAQADDSGRSEHDHPPQTTDSPGNYSNGVATPPRKRSRKGKAYKLDTICLKLQERYGDSPDLEEGQEGQKESDGSETASRTSVTPPGDAVVNTEAAPQEVTPVVNNLSSIIPKKRKLLMPEKRADTPASLNGEGHGDVITAETHECQPCGITFSDVIMFTMHSAYHSLNNPWRCNMCGHEARDKIDFFLHIARQPHA